MNKLLKVILPVAFTALFVRADAQQVPQHLPKNIIYLRPFSPVTGHFDMGYERYFTNRDVVGSTFRYFFKAVDFYSENPEPKGFDGTIYYKRMLSKRAPAGWFARGSLVGGWYHTNAEYEDCSHQVYGDGRWHCYAKYAEQKFFTMGPGIAFGHQWLSARGALELMVGFKYLPVPDKPETYPDGYSLKHLWGNVDWRVPAVSPGAVADFNFSLGFRF